MEEIQMLNKSQIYLLEKLHKQKYTLEMRTMGWMVGFQGKAAPVQVQVISWSQIGQPLEEEDSEHSRT